MGIPGILAAATYYLQAISAGGFVTGLLLLLKFLAKGVELTLEAASVVSLLPQISSHYSYRFASDLPSPFPFPFAAASVVSLLPQMSLPLFL